MKLSSPRPLLAGTALLASALLTLSGCGSAVAPATQPAASGAGSSLENCGRQVRTAQIPQSVVGMHPAQTELLVRLGQADKLAGQGQAAAQQLPAEVASQLAEVPQIGGALPPSREDLLAVAPDFVYSPTTYEFTAEQGFASIEQLEQAGAAVYVAAGGCQDRRMTGEVTDLFTDLQNLGGIFAAEQAAADLIATSTAQLERVSEALEGVAKLRVAQVYVDGTTLQGIGAGIEYDILRLAGAENIFTPEQPAFAKFFAATITPEALAAEEPEALVFTVHDPEHEASTREYLARTFPQMPAVKHKRLIAVSSTDVFPGTLGNVKAVSHIAEQLYPEAF